MRLALALLLLSLSPSFSSPPPTFPSITTSLLPSSEPAKPVYACCECPESSESPDTCESFAPVEIGALPQMTPAESISQLNLAVAAWDGGMGTWPQLTTEARCVAIEQVLVKLMLKRTAMIDALMFEIGKTKADATAEFDRTIVFIRSCITLLRDNWGTTSPDLGGTLAYIRRAAVGVILALGPANYPLNETYAMVIPALLTGNTVVMKIPAAGSLVHLLTIDAFTSTLPPGTLTFISGGGRVTCPPVMETGLVDGLAFIGGSAAADSLIRSHPQPHRLKVFSQLEAKNMAVFLPDDPLEDSLTAALSGALSYNGQRCTALKLLYVPVAKRDEFKAKFTNLVHSLPVGMPWEDTSKITPLPDKKRIDYMLALLADAKAKGGEIVGGSIIGGPASTLMAPAIVYGVTEGMRLYSEEQFGPIVAVAFYEDLNEIVRNAKEGIYAQQISLFTAGTDNGALATIVDKFSKIFGKINLNAAAGRSPDSLAFSGRRSSAMGTMSVDKALEAFTVETVVSAKREHEEIWNDVLARVNFAK